MTETRHFFIQKNSTHAPALLINMLENDLLELFQIDGKTIIHFITCSIENSYVLNAWSLSLGLQNPFYYNFDSI